MKVSVSDRICLVTGSTRGIGREIAEHLHSAGYTVVGCGRSDPVEKSPFHHIRADVSVESDVVSMFREIRKTFGRIDVLVNNAGTAGMNHILLTPGSAVEKLLKINTLGTFLVSREAAKLMKRQRSGRIVNMTTVAVPLNLEGEAAYVMSKAGVEALTRVMARELGQFGITVNAVGPVPIDTALISGVPEEKIEHLIARQAIRRKGTFADVNNVVDFFITPASDFVTGQVIYLGGV